MGDSSGVAAMPLGGEHQAMEGRRVPRWSSCRGRGRSSAPHGRVRKTWRAVTEGSRQKLPELAQTLVEALARELELVEGREQREHGGERDAEREELGTGHLRPARREDDRVDEAVRKPDRKEGDGYQHHAEERVDRAHVRARRSRLDRE